MQINGDRTGPVALNRLEMGTSTVAAATLPSISVADQVVSEGDDLITVWVTLSAPATQSVTVRYVTAEVTADGANDVNGYDYNAVSGMLTFQAGETRKPVQIQLSQSQGIEGLEHFRFNLNTPTNATIAQTSAMISIVDNDRVAALPSLFVRDVVVDERAGTAGFVVMLGGPTGQRSNSIVTVDYATGGGNATAGSD